MKTMEIELIESNMDKRKKPEDIKDYLIWLSECHHKKVDGSTRTYYKGVSHTIKNEFFKSDLWSEICNSLKVFDQKYKIETSYDLLYNINPPELLIKTYDSYLSKTYRKNIINNKNYPEKPSEGWVFPEEDFSKINDIVRTSISVKYLDGVEFIISEIREICKKHEAKFTEYYEAREEGYYAAHCYIYQDIEIPKKNWDTRNINIRIEIQITTQLQEIIKTLLQKYYEEKRQLLKPPDIKWQWDYKGDEFATNYLGHILHYVEGMIMDIRERN